MEHDKKNIFLIILLLCLCLVFCLAYLPLKEQKKKRADKKPNMDQINSRLYIILMELFGDSLYCENRIISYGSSDGDEYIDSFVPDVTVTSVILSCDTLYLKLDYKYDSKQIIKYDDDCFVKIDQENKMAYLFTKDRYVFYDEEAKELVRFYAALKELSKGGLNLIMEEL